MNLIHTSIKQALLLSISSIFFIFSAQTSVFSQTKSSQDTDGTMSLKHRIEREWPARLKHDKVTSYLSNLCWKLSRTSQNPHVDWQIVVLRDRSVNAYSIGNGSIFVTEGAIKFAQSDSEMAAIIGHEMSHEWLGHFLSESQSGQKGFWNSFWSLLKINKKNDRIAQVGSIYQSFDIEKEKEADRMTVQLLKDAGFNPDAMIKLNKRLMQLSGDPIHLERIEALQEMAGDTSHRLDQNTHEFQRIRNLIE